MTLILLPGLLCDASVWQDLLPALRHKVACVVPDYAALDSIESMAQQVFHTTPPGPLALAGHSMGGRVALEMLRQQPERIQRLALMDTGYEGLAPGAAGEKERAGRMALLQTARQHGMRAMGRDWARGMVHPSRLDSPLFARILDMIERRTPEIFEAQIHALLQRPDASALLGQIRCPTLLLCGREDAWSPLARHEQMLGLMPQAHAELTVVEHAGHMSPMEQPDAVGQALLRWLGNMPA
ncbi:alpha/beta fold hydrolase [Rhodoferax sp.]|uniref:alpha/beta fold hydrolase n=1 Tax=Rhodoferax sp. TaxID=50421 RepID=UPI00374DAAB2